MFTDRYVTWSTELLNVKAVHSVDVPMSNESFLAI